MFNNYGFIEFNEKLRCFTGSDFTPFDSLSRSWQLCGLNDNDIIPLSIKENAGIYQISTQKKFSSWQEIKKDYALVATNDRERFFPRVLGKDMQLEVAGECNLKCVMCPQAFDIFNKNLTIEDLDILEPIFLEYDQFELNHQGETLMSPILDKFLSKIHPNNHVYFNTNGFLLSSKNSDLLKRFLPPVRLIRFSIDSDDEDIFQNIRGGKLNVLKSRIRKFVYSLSDENRHHLILSIGCVVMRHNMNSLDGLIDFASEIGSNVEFWPMSIDVLHGGNNWKIEKKDFFFDYKSELLSKTEWSKISSDLVSKGEKTGVEVIIPPLLNSNDDECELSVKDCELFGRHAHFNGGGRAQHCCHQTHPIFNWREEGVDFWSHSRVKEIEALAKKDIIPFECAGARCSYVNGKPSSEEGLENYHPGTGNYLKRGYI